ncbi:putative integral membrane protein [Chaetomidium leptoderma]|uniref:Integral membrane protein n=1 Tax=Chaetomidium leptoderma TaxID=669021 RepID=A0AAN6VS31_9PEZI|nr:putative integral membrane protein [Chaetomidium leptoderma]
MVVYVDLATNPRGVTIVSVLWTMITLSGLFVGLRLYSKLTRIRRLWWDDYFIIVAWILLLVSCSTSTANTRLGFGLHDYQVPLENLVTFGIQSNISGFASVIAVACSKTSFAITLLRLTDGWMKWFIIGLIVILNITQYTSAVFFWVSCNPPAKTWNPMLPGECWPVSFTINFSLFVGSCSAFCDFSLALLPWRLLLRFNMYNREKIGVAIAMSMGIFAGISCIVKMTTIPILRDGDFSYNSLPLVLWGFIEPSLTIIAASLPMMRHLFKSFRHDDDDDNNNNNNNGDPHSNNTTTITSTSAAAAAATLSSSSNTTTTTTSIGGGGRDTRHLAAARANHPIRGSAAAATATADGGGSNNSSSGYYHRSEYLSQASQQQQQQQHQQHQQQQFDEKMGLGEGG